MVIWRLVLNHVTKDELPGFKKFRWTYVFRVVFLSRLFMRSSFTGQIKWCALFWWEGGCNKTAWRWHEKNSSRQQNNEWYKGKFPFLRMQKQTRYLIIVLTMCLLMLLGWTGDNSHRSSKDWIYPFVVCGEDRRHLSSQQSPSVDGPSLSSLSFCVPVSVFQPTVYCVGGSYFSSNIKPPHRRAHGPPSRGAAWTCCSDCCPFPSGRLTSNNYFLQDFMTEL